MATPKQLALEAVNSLPEDCSMEDIFYTLYVRQKVEEGLEDVRKGRLVSQEEIERDLAKWLAE